MLSQILLFARFGIGLREISFAPGRVVVRVKIPAGLRRIVTALGVLLLAIGVYGIYTLGPGWDDSDRVDAVLQTLTALAALGGAWVLPQPMTITASPVTIEVTRETLFGTVRTSEPTTEFTGLRLHHSLQDTMQESPVAAGIRIDRYRDSLHTGIERTEYWWIEAVHPIADKTVFLHLVRGMRAPRDQLQQLADTLRLPVLPAAGDP